MMTLFTEKKIRAGNKKTNPLLTSSLAKMKPIKFLETKSKIATSMDVVNESKIPADKIDSNVSGSEEYCGAWRNTDKWIPATAN